MIKAFTKLKALSAVMLIALLTVFMLPLKTDAAKGMDEILFYGIEAHLQDTGSVELKYTIEWKVLKDDSDGGVSWVKIGIPNPNAEKFTALSDNIKSVSYMSEGGCFAKVNFKTEYHAGATFRFSFSILQHNLFQEPKSSKANYAAVDQNEWDGLYVYSFTPGWFPDIPVDRYEIKWDAAKVSKCDAPFYGGYYVKSGTLPVNGQAYIRVGYNSGSYTFTRKTVLHPFSGFSEDDIALIVKIVLIIVMIIICRLLFGDNYHYNGRHGGYHHFHGHGGGCACACACACAGGGRAGCSRKDFYGTKVSAKRLKKVLKDGAKDAESETV